MKAKITERDTLERLNKLPDIQDFSESDKKFYAEIGSSLLTSELDDLLRKKEYIMGVIMAASMLDYVGKIRLIWEFKGIVSKKKIYPLELATVSKLLFASKIIHGKTYAKMEEIRNVRNELAHNMLSHLTTPQPNNKLESLIKDAKGIISLLFARALPK
jgi:hypothetical protein